MDTVGAFQQLVAHIYFETVQLRFEVARLKGHDVDSAIEAAVTTITRESVGEFARQQGMSVEALRDSFRGTLRRLADSGLDTLTGEELS